MDFWTHTLAGLVLIYILWDFSSNTFFWVLLGSTLADIIWEFFYQMWRRSKWKTVKILYDDEVTDSSKSLWDSIYMYPYNLSHSIFAPAIFWILGFPGIFIIAYSIHLFLDIASHAKQNWWLMLFWPLLNKRFWIQSNWWEWKYLKWKNIIYFNICTYILVGCIILLI